MSESTATLIAGLGNPGPRYAETRHNIGFMVITELARRSGARAKQHASQALIAETRIDSRRAVLAQPVTYMNRSGGPIKAVMKYFRIPVENLIVIHDDLDLAFEQLKVKIGGGDGGHNGLRSIRSSLGTGEYTRVRVGIDRPHPRVPTEGYVLGRFTATQRRELDAVIQRSADAVESILAHGVTATQNTFHAQ